MTRYEVAVRRYYDEIEKSVRQQEVYNSVIEMAEDSGKYTDDELSLISRSFAVVAAQKDNYIAELKAIAEELFDPKDSAEF